MTTTSAIKKYLHSDEFRCELVERYKDFKILSEAGLRTAIANMLDVKIHELGGSARGYRVTCETRLADSNVIPDVLIWKNGHPRICLELKDTQGLYLKKAEDDWLKLQNYRKLYPSVKASYLIYVARLDIAEFPIKRNRETLQCWPIAIGLKSHMEDFDRWELEYQRRAHYKAAVREGTPFDA